MGAMNLKMLTVRCILPQFPQSTGHCRRRSFSAVARLFTLGGIVGASLCPAPGSSVIRNRCCPIFHVFSKSDPATGSPWNSPHERSAHCCCADPDHGLTTHSHTAFNTNR